MIISIIFVSTDEELFPKIRQINCLKNDVMVTWINRNQNAYSDIWDHCVHYNCSTPGGDVTGAMVG